ncbi:hypothetical protein ACFE04_021743 [Oxalis oulophora]
MVAREYLLRGASWRVGNGKEISEDNWVIGKLNSIVLMNPLIVVLPAHVCDMLHGHRMCWNVNLLRVVFSKEQVEVIHAIALVSGQVDDTFIWDETSNGQYSQNML